MSDTSKPPAGAGLSPVVQMDRRRRVLQAGLAAAPVLMTLASRPVLGQQCQAPSAAVSGNVSVATASLPICLGHVATWWVANQSAWPSGYYPTNKSGPGGVNATRFRDVFINSPYN